MKFLWLSLIAPVATYGAGGLETILVTAPSQGSLMFGQQLDAAAQMPGAGAEPAEHLFGFAGVQVDSRSNYAQDTRITLRGFGARSAFGVRGLDLSIDGIPLTMPDGQGQFSGVVLDNISQVTVLSGPLAALYGNGAGGVIALQTQAPAANDVAVAGAFDNNGLQRQQLFGTWREGDFGLRVQANRLDAEGNRPHASAQRQQLGIQSYYRFTNGIQSQWRLDKEDAPLLQDPLGLTQAQWRADPRQLNPAAELFNTRKAIKHHQNALSLKQDQGTQRWQFTLWQGRRRIEQYLAQSGDAIANSGGVVDLTRHFTGANGNYTWDLNASDLSLTLGAEYGTMEDVRQGFVNLNGTAGAQRRNELGHVTSRDEYLISQWRPSEKWLWLTGLRHSRLNFTVDDYFVVPGNSNDSGTRHFNHLVPVVAGHYQITPQWAAKFSSGQSFESPTLTETAYTSGDKGFNSTLNSARNQQNELGVGFTQTNRQLNLTIFDIRSQNEIVVDQSNNGRTSYHNAADTQRQGLALSARWLFSPQWNSRFASSYLNAAYTSGQWADKQLPGVASVNSYLQINWLPWASEVFQASLSIAKRSAMATSDNNIIWAPASITADLAMSGAMNFSSSRWRTQWWLKLANIADSQYVGSVIVNQTNGRAFEPAVGRNLAGGMRVGYEF